MSHGGARAGAGRKKGVPSKATVERKLRAAHGIKSAIDEGLLPLDVMLRKMRGDDTITAAQLQAAIAAAPYIHPRLASTEVSGKDGGPMIVQLVRHADDPAPE